MNLLSASVLAFAVLTSACGGSESSTPAEPTPVGAEPTKTETFTGTVQPRGYDSHNFTIVVAPGTVNVTLTAIGPPETITTGLGIGTPSSNGVCNLDFGPGSYLNTQASSSPQIKGTVANAGEVCVVVYDVGFQMAPVNYTVVVSHS